ncbi:MAG: carbohydrate kinase family protein [Acidobacteriia bacterium]|nr:carbohydrate kinase family protein [Terriglobia bacterium]
MHKEKSPQRSRLVAAGLCSLDIVFGLEDPAPKFYAGGTCGNVVAGLAFLGWDAIPIARLAHDVAGEFVRGDLERWGVNTSLLGLDPTGATPIILEKIQTSKNGIPKHRFLWNCPDCGSYFPPFKPVLRTQVEDLKKKLGRPEIFYADRVSRSAVELARHFRHEGSLIYFEPSAGGDPKLFREMLQLCDVLKYSAQRARSFSELLRDHKAYLEIETLGEDGLRFRTRRAFTSWQTVAAYEVSIKDTAGSGDWTSIGLMSEMLGEGRKALEKCSKQRILSCLEHAQAIAALNCQFEGPRGGMYQLSRSRFMQSLTALKAKKPGDSKQRKISLIQQLSTAAVCPSCGPTDNRRPRLDGEKRRSAIRTASEK